MSGVKKEARDKVENTVVVTGGFGFGGDLDGGLEGTADGGGRGEVWDGDYDGQTIKWGLYCSKHNLRDRAYFFHCLCSGIGTAPPDCE